MNAYFLFSVLILAFLLYFPTSKLIWVLSVKRLQKKSHTDLNKEEIYGQKQRARFIALILVLVFSYLFNIGFGIGLNV